MEKKDVLKALKNYLKTTDCNPYLSGSHKIDKLCFHSESWVTGGVGGGSCWDTGEEDHHYELSEQQSQSIECLEQFLEEFYPHLSLSQYQELIYKVKNEYWTENEYYGNYTNYRCAYITFEDIADFFANLNKPETLSIYR
jgi:transcriptional antiterminator